MGFASLRQVSDRIAFSFLSIYAKGFGVAVHRWLRIPFLHPQPLLRRRFCTAPCRGRRLCRPDVSGWHRTAVKCGDTATVASQTYFFCCARKSRQKDALGRVLYCALPRASFWPLRGLNALFGRRFVTSPIAFNSGKCTTRICGQTASTSVLLISGILGRLRYCTAYCRGRCLHRPIGNLRIRRRFP